MPKISFTTPSTKKIQSAVDIAINYGKMPPTKIAQIECLQKLSFEKYKNAIELGAKMSTLRTLESMRYCNSIGWTAELPNGGRVYPNDPRSTLKFIRIK